jgi:hypothetical protein
MKTPVAFIIFNRPDTTARVFEAIRQAKPPKLFVIADGPRQDRVSDIEKCAMTREIIDNVDWNCEVFTNYSDVNLGCGKRVSTGITWVFEQVEEAIILEDDTLPGITFFHFCEVLLDKYREDERIMAISGTNLLGEWKSDIQSYHFSYYGGIWGWASWRRAWKYYDYEMKLWPNQETQKRIRDVLASDEQFIERARYIQRTFDGSIDTWDFQWAFARLTQSGLSVVPSVNLVSNIGFGEDATHTTSSDSKLAYLKIDLNKSPLQINYFVAVDRDYDNLFFNEIIKNSSSLSTIKRKIYDVIRKISLIHN